MNESMIIYGILLDNYTSYLYALEYIKHKVFSGEMVKGHLINQLLIHCGVINY